MIPLLTIIVPIYNHEKYLVQALDSIRMQIIEYPFEVIIGEDNSTDQSNRILCEYEKTAPSNYTFIYRSENKGMFGNITDLFQRAKGKYIIMLEGDDYWDYPYKINEQINFLEKNQNYSGCAHSVLVIDEKERVVAKGYEDEIGEGIYSLKNYLEGKLPGQTASFMYRNYFTNTGIFEYMKNNVGYPLDRFIAYVVASKGNIYCMSQKWSVYRFVTGGGSSYSANLNSTTKEFALSALSYHRGLYDYSLDVKINRDSIMVSEKLYYKSFMRNWRDGNKKSFKLLFGEIIKMKHPIRTLFWIFVQYLKM